MSDGVEWSLHCCTVLALLPPEFALPAARLAEFHDVPPAYLSKHLQALSRAGIVTSVPGPRGGYRLGRSADKITLLQVVEAVEGGVTAFRCAEIRQRGPAAVGPEGYRVACGIARAMYKAEAAWRNELRSQTIADMVRSMTADISPEAAAKGAVWMQEVLR